MCPKMFKQNLNKMIKKFLPLAYLLLIIGTACAQEKKEATTLILVRHAEKVDDGTRDPALSAAGKERAQVLIELLRETPIEAIYSTPYKRTRETVEPLAHAKGISVTEYKPHDWDVLKKIVDENKGKTIVMVGHSNTTPWVANVLLGEEKKYPDWKDDDYDNVLIVSEFGDGHTNVTWLTYGKATSK